MENLATDPLPWSGLSDLQRRALAEIVKRPINPDMMPADLKGTNTLASLVERKLVKQEWGGDYHLTQLGRDALQVNPKRPADQTPCEIDTQLAHWWSEGSLATQYRKSAEERLKRERERGLEFQIKNATEELAKWEARCRVILAAQYPLQAEFQCRGGWKRYYLVPKGHVHRETSCHTCTYKTLFNWLPELSACDETVMVEKYGDLACAECFPQVLTHPAFIASAAARKADEERKRSAQCPSSAQPVGNTNRTPNGRRARCPSCNCIVPITRYGLFRQHNPPVRKS